MQYKHHAIVKNAGYAWKRFVALTCSCFHEAPTVLPAARERGREGGRGRERGREKERERERECNCQNK